MKEFPTIGFTILPFFKTPKLSINTVRVSLFFFQVQNELVKTNASCHWRVSDEKTCFATKTG